MKKTLYRAGLAVGLLLVFGGRMSGGKTVDVPLDLVSLARRWRHALRSWPSRSSALAASAFVAVTPTPHPGSPWGQCLSGRRMACSRDAQHTKETGIPVVDAIHSAQLAILAERAGSVPPPAVGPNSTIKAVAAIVLLFGHRHGHRCLYQAAG